MKYPSATSSVSASGAFVQPPVATASSTAAVPIFLPWQPSTWPDLSTSDPLAVVPILRRIVDETMLSEIANVISDAQAQNGGLEHRGHVVGISILCTLDAVAAYGYRGGVGKRIVRFVEKHFPPEYRNDAKRLYDLYRCKMVHGWNLFEVTIWPGDEPFMASATDMSVGLLTLFVALQNGIDDFFAQLGTDDHLRDNVFRCYNKLRTGARR